MLRLLRHNIEHDAFVNAALVHCPDKRSHGSRSVIGNLALLLKLRHRRVGHLIGKNVCMKVYNHEGNYITIFYFRHR